jgi:cyclopropane-fatty-acyl-phospholipid synthase
MFSPFDPVSFGEAYIYDDFDIEGDIFKFTDWLGHIVRLADQRGIWGKLQLLRSVMAFPKQANPRNPRMAGTPTEGDHSLEKDRVAISYAYDVPGDFYRLFLGPTMLYSCAYFSSLEQSIDDAQTDKLDLICRKLRLKPGERLADIGCGWGGLLIHAAKNYGVEAVGLTVAGKQAEWAEQNIRKSGVGERAKVVCCDYREIEKLGTFDKVASIGIAEHIGHANLPIYFNKIWQVLKPGGVLLHHSITLRPNTPYPRWTAFARKYVFPNGELHSILTALTAAAGAGFEIRDVESLREHYILTLTQWVRRLETNHTDAVKLLDEIGYRVFKIYMAGATLGFRSGVYNLYQTLLLKPQNGISGLPLRRSDWYSQAKESSV